MSKKQIRVAISGASGRMGQEIAKLVEQEKNLSLVAGVGLGTISDLFPLKYKSAAEIKPRFDVLVDFTLPEVFSANLKAAVEQNVAFVCGTTGLSEKQFKELEKAAKGIPVLWSSNMSLGIAWLNQMLKEFKTIEDFDFQIEELHHKRKLDAPSGTAKTLQENLSTVLERKLPPVVAIRGGGIFGVHKIWAMSEEEVITVEHTALNRSVFAKGAIRAAKFLANKKPGLYKMSDVLFGEE